MRVFGTACAHGVGDDTVTDSRVDVNSVLPSHEIVNDLQHRPIKGVRMVKPNDVALDLASNAMYVTKSSIGFEPSILFNAASAHYSHVLN